jgi:hypothetical protein
MNMPDQLKCPEPPASPPTAVEETYTPAQWWDLCSDRQRERIEMDWLESVGNVQVLEWLIALAWRQGADWPCVGREVRASWLAYRETAVLALRDKGAIRPATGE